MNKPFNPNACGKSEGDSAGDKESAASVNVSSFRDSYFNAIYADNADPWQYETRWYEKRKRDMCLATLPNADYQQAIELGCANGVFSERLAARCHQLICIDGNEQAIKLAEQRLSEYPRVKVIQGIIPNVLHEPFLQQIVDSSRHATQSSQLPPNKDNDDRYQPSFDLIVISEMLYYLSLDAINEVLHWVDRSLTPHGTLLCCHWRYNIDGFALNGERVHQHIQRKLVALNSDKPQSNQLLHQTKLVDKDFLLDVWQRTSQSVAEHENLL